MKFAVLDVNEVLQHSRRGRELTQKLQILSRTWQNKWQAVEDERHKKIEQLRVNEKRPAAAATENPRLERDLQGLELEMSYLRQRGEAELKNHVQESQRVIMEELAPILAAYAQKNGISAVFPMPATPLLYADPAIDVTKEVIALYDARQPMAARAS